MLRNYIAAALGNLSRNWLYAGITILGLSVSFAADTIPSMIAGQFRLGFPWLFLAASAAAVLIAWATVSIHAWLVARAKPALALRYE